MYAPASLTLSASASDSDGTIAKVEFYQGTTLIGTATSAPYAVNWPNVAAGTYEVTARATDNLGGVTISAPVSVTVKASALTFAAPLDGAALTGDNVLVKGSFQGSPNAGITVNGVVAALDADNNFYASVPLAPGANMITATLTPQAGQASTKSMTVTRDGASSPIRMSADRVEGVAPLSVNFSIQGTGLTASVAVSGAGVTIAHPDANTVAVTYPAAGAYPTALTVTDSGGHATVRQYLIVAQDAAQVDQKFRALWNGMNNAVVAGDKATALSYLSGPAR